MALDNPAFSRNAAFKPNNAAAVARMSATAGTTATSSEDLERLYASPSATPHEMERMSYQDTVHKTILLFAVLLAAGVVAWFVPILALPGALAGLALGLVNSFKRSPSAPLILAYAACEGLFVGGISSLFEHVPNLNGIVIQAVAATLVVFGVTLALFASGKVRASKRATKVFLVAMVGYVVFSLVNVGFMVFGHSDLAFGLRSAEIGNTGIKWGLLIGVLAVLMAAYSLVLDFEFIKNGVDNGAPRKFGWFGAFGLVVTLVWLYLEFLRLIALQRN